MSDKISHGSAASLDDLDPCTFMAWVRPTASTLLRALVSKGAFQTPTLTNFVPSGNLRLFWQSSGTALNYVTNDAPLAALNKWYFVAFYVDTGAANHGGIFVGDLGAPAVESSYVAAVNRTGKLNGNAAEDLVVGNTGSSSAWLGDVGWASFWNRRLTLDQMIAQQFRPRVAEGCVMFCHYGFNGTGPQADWSGSGNGGSVTGAAARDHVPLGAPVAVDSEWWDASTRLATPVAAHHRYGMSA